MKIDVNAISNVPQSTSSPDALPMLKILMPQQLPEPATPPASARVVPETAVPKPSVPAVPPVSEAHAKLLETFLRSQAAALHQTLAQQIQTLGQKTHAIKERREMFLEKKLEEIRGRWQEDLKRLETQMHSEKEQWRQSLKEKDILLEKLSREITELRKALEEQKAAPAVKTEPPLSSPPWPTFVPPPSVLLEKKEEPVREEEPSLSADGVTDGILNEETPFPRKVAFLSKLWNYLNQPAIEIPPYRGE